MLKWFPLAGDWNGDRRSTVGAVQLENMEFHLINDLTTGAPLAAPPFQFGSANSVPIVGDWNGDGKDGIGVFYRTTSQFLLRNDLSGGDKDFEFSHGGPNCVPIVGDWDGDGRDGIGAVFLERMEFHLRNSLSQGPAQILPIFYHGGPNPLPVPLVVLGGS
jgi:hypothetical protein